MGGLWRSIGFTSGARIYSLVAGLVGLVITARVLGPSGRGAVATATTWALLFATLGYLSLGQVAIHRATEKDPAEWLGSTLGALLAMTGVGTLLGWSAAALIYAAPDGRAYGDGPAYPPGPGFATPPFPPWGPYGNPP